ncbi:sodium:alanine symporter family protein [Chimaeribacter arupi]|uniref:alanine/glycine:cation symporter family protein n=1 Tax=Chimaeribacter arupi TaxID=2060066 RepID=UPI000C7A77CC|nr:amino acid carrier protein [Chimaeribacter arupi]PLR47929.1 sodium:alanine symporter family protein [Chimaeribacter arupi]
MTELLDFLNALLWDSILIYLLIGAGLYFIYRTGGLPLRHLPEMFRVLMQRRAHPPGSLSAWQALCLSLAGRVGAGNLAGVAVAINTGGPGAIFWMWVISWLSMITALVESTLGQLYKTRDSHGQLRGGPACYMEKGLGMRWMGVVFALLLIFAFGFAFNTLQAGTMAVVNRYALNCPPLVLALGLLLPGGLVLSGGLPRIARCCALLVPLLLLLYLALTLWTMATHLAALPQVFAAIFRGAFGAEQAAGGAMGYGMSQAMTQGAQRGMFSNEAGLGTVPNAAASARPTPLHPVSQGYMQMLGVVVDTLMISSATAMIMLLAGTPGRAHPAQGVTLTPEAFAAFSGLWGGPLVTLVVFLFAFTAMLANYAYAENNLLFLTRHRPVGLVLLRVLVLLAAAAGILWDISWLYPLATIATALMTLTNLTALLLLSGVAFTLIKDYHRQRQIGREPVFNPAHFPALQKQLSPGIWERER